MGEIACGMVVTLVMALTMTVAIVMVIVMVVVLTAMGGGGGAGGALVDALTVVEHSTMAGATAMVILAARELK